MCRTDWPKPNFLLLTQRVIINTQCEIYTGKPKIINFTLYEDSLALVRQIARHYRYLFFIIKPGSFKIQRDFSLLLIANEKPGQLCEVY